VHFYLMPKLPYFPQPKNSRMCAAAALRMVYTFYGVEGTTESIWERISLPDRRGGRYSESFRVAGDALNQGLHAVVFRAEDPLGVLRAAARHEVQVLMNHRVSSESLLGHYTVLTGIPDGFVVVHDPDKGPHRKVSAARFLQLWKRLPGPRCEITGNIAVAIAKPPLAPITCAVCHSPPPAPASCVRCGEPIDVQPFTVIGCMNRQCAGRLWRHIICPWCDATYG
jgi:hypothetical protein